MQYTIKPYVKNAKRHPDSQLKLIASSLREYGWRQPIVTDKDGTIIVGHGRWMAYEKYPDGIKEPWVVKADDLTPEQVRGYRLMDNKTNESEWDMSLAAEELKELDKLGFDVALTGFDGDLLIESDEKDDVVPTDAPTRAKLGDVWALGAHKVMCGDSTDSEAVGRLMGGIQAQMLYTDPPYGLGGYAGRSGKFDPIKGDNEDVRKFYDCLPHLPERYIWGNWKVMFLLGEYPRDVIVWNKQSVGMGKGYRGQYELCFYYGTFKGSDSDLWDVKRATDYKHPTQKPVELGVRAIKNSCETGDVVLDLFLGSGSTLIAAEKTGRVCYGIELDPKYVDVILKRWEDYTGEAARKL